MTSRLLVCLAGSSSNFKRCSTFFLNMFIMNPLSEFKDYYVSIFYFLKSFTSPHIISKWYIPGDFYVLNVFSIKIDLL